MKITHMLCCICLSVTLASMLAETKTVTLWPDQIGFNSGDWNRTADGKWWYITNAVQVSNYMPYTMNVSFSVITIPSYVSKVDIYTGELYNTSVKFDGSHMRYFDDLPNTSWVSMPRSIMCLPSTASPQGNVTTMSVPYNISVPYETEHSDKLYQFFIEMIPAPDGNIQTSMASKVLIHTPSVPMEVPLSFIAAVFTGIIVLFVCSLVYIKGKVGKHE